MKRATVCPMRPIVAITALMSEAAPLIEKWRLKPARNAPLLERFQTFAADGRYVLVSGIGKLKSATATSVITATLGLEADPLLVNIGVAGASQNHAGRGELFVVNKVRDVATNIRFYPDILVRHLARESALDTYDHPVDTPPRDPVLVDMEASGFMHAATNLLCPSSVLLLKVVSDYCTSERLIPADVSSLIEDRLDLIDTVIASWHTELKTMPLPDSDEVASLERLSITARFSQSQRLELQRLLVAFKAGGGTLSDILVLPSEHEPHSKYARRALFNKILGQLRGVGLP